MNILYMDLHIHSIYSDGTMSPMEIIEECERNNVSVVSITDHNVLEGSKEGKLIACEKKISFITGVEIDAIEDGVNYHILAYNVDLDDELFAERIKSNRAKLEEVNLKLLEKLIKDYDGLSFREYYEFDYEHNKGGWKLLHYLVYKKIAKDINEAFSFYIDYEHSYTCVDFPGIQEVCNWIHEAGGVAVLAHPGKVIEGDEAHFREMLSYIVEYGLDGIECIYPSHTRSVTDICLSVAEEKKMIITSGSDCHGSFEDTIIGEMKCCVNDRIKEMVE